MIVKSVRAFAFILCLTAPAAASAQTPNNILLRIIYLLRVDASALHEKYTATQKLGGTTVTVDRKSFLEAMKFAHANYKDYDVRGLTVKVTASTGEMQNLSYSYRFSLTLNGQRLTGTVTGVGQFVMSGGKWIFRKDDSVSTLVKSQ